MKNKIKLKKLIILFSVVCLIFITSLLLLNIYEYHIYNRNYNYKIASFVDALKYKYPDITDKEILEIINNSDNKNNLLDKYSYNLDKTVLVSQNKKDFKKFIIINSIFYILSLVSFIYIFLRFNNKKDQEINKITKYIEQINNKNYKLDLDSISEDELSILKNEIYKTTINLKELAEISNNEKLELKKSLSDISHQLKTPITSINIILDNLLEDATMDKDTRNDFIKDIKREISNINFLVQSILKLSKLDTNTIEFHKEDVSINKVINEAIKNVSMLSDLRNVKINYNNSKTIINCDYKWQVEALSNILKNSIEHSYEGDAVNILCEDNKVYLSITITNMGKEIDKDDLPHIFERFYKGKNSLNDSIGIGLSLSKALIEKENGKINVESNNGQTSFIIKYFK